jgi:hypothetical protein
MHTKKVFVVLKSKCWSILKEIKQDGPQVKLNFLMFILRVTFWVNGIYKENLIFDGLQFS